VVAVDDLLADPVELAEWLNVDVSDPLVTAALRAASRRFRGAVGHHVSKVVGDTVTLDGDGTRVLLLPAVPVTAVTSVTVTGTALVAGTDFEWSDDGMLERLNGCGWPCRYRSVTVVYDHGWDPVPEDIQEAIIDQARSGYRVLPGVQSIQAGGESVTFGAAASVGVTSQWTKAVTRYRINRGDRA
jgi:hypothetical protein